MAAPHSPYRESSPPKDRVEGGPALARDDTGMVWSWVFLGSVLVPVLIFMACTSVLGGGGVAATPERGGTASFGETFEYSDGLAVHTELGGDRVATLVTITVTNGTDRSLDGAAIRTVATVDGGPTDRAAGSDGLPPRNIRPGGSLTFTQAFAVPSGTAGSVQVAVRHGLREPVFFSGPK